MHRLLKAFLICFDSLKWMWLNLAKIRAQKPKWKVKKKKNMTSKTSNNFQWILQCGLAGCHRVGATVCVSAENNDRFSIRRLLQTPFNQYRPSQLLISSFNTGKIKYTPHLPLHPPLPFRAPSTDEALTHDLFCFLCSSPWRANS